MLKVFEAFSGIGTQRMALKRLGIEHEVVGIAEIDRFALYSYTAIHGKTYNVGDISKVDIESIPDHDLFTYSFPCQDISTAGLQKGLDKDSGTRSSLLWECYHIIEHIRPKYLLMENVKNLVGKRHKNNFDEWLQQLEHLGYKSYWQVLNAKDYGVPQNRERVFVVSILDQGECHYQFPVKKELEIHLKDLLENDVPEKFYLSDEQINSIVTSNFNQNKSRIQQKNYCDTLCAGDYKRLKCFEIPIKNATKKGYLIANEYDSVDLAYPNSKTRRGRVQKGVSHTLTCDDSKSVVVDSWIRKLTSLECWRLMGVSDEDFYKAQAFNSNTQLYKQAGNAIVVDVLVEIFRELFKEE